MNAESWMEVTLPDKTITKVKLMKNTRRKRICIKADVCGISVMSPVNQNIEEIRKFVNSSHSWISKKIKFYSKLNNK